jgi:hypothetical protein
MKQKMLIVALVLIVGSAFVSASAAGKSAVKFGTGISGDADGVKAGLEAAFKAKKGIGKASPKIVLVFAGRKQLNAEMIEAVGAIFDKKLIYGCEGYSPLSNETNLHDQGHNSNGVAVLAVCGDVAIKVASANTKDAGGRENAGAKIGQALKDASKVDAKGKLLITFGDQHVGKDNADLVAGLKKALGEKFPIVGAAAGGGGAKEIVAGKIVTGTNVGVLITGGFKVSLATDGSNADLPKTAKNALTSAVGGDKDKVMMAFIFDCGGRRGGMVGAKTIKKEFENMKEVLGSNPFFGFYGGGEIGCKDNDSPAKGVGYSVSTAVIIKD